MITLSFQLIFFISNYPLSTPGGLWKDRQSCCGTSLQPCRDLRHRDGGAQQVSGDHHDLQKYQETKSQSEPNSVEFSSVPKGSQVCSVHLPRLQSAGEINNCLHD